jgi:hypothetical protein
MIWPPLNSNLGRYMLDGVAAVVADAQPLPAEREVAGHGAQLAVGHDLVVDVELERPVGLVVLAHALLGELHPHDVAARAGRRGREAGLGRDAEEVVGVGQGAVLDEQRVPAEPRPVGEDHPLGVAASSPPLAPATHPWCIALLGRLRVEGRAAGSRSSVMARACVLALQVGRQAARLLLGKVSADLLARAVRRRHESTWPGAMH